MAQKIKKSERATYGQVFISHKGKAIPTSVGSESYEGIFGGEQVNFPKTMGVIPPGYEHRPELISNIFLKTPVGWWIVCERNSIFDVFEQLNPGDSIKIPVKL